MRSLLSTSASAPTHILQRQEFPEITTTSFSDYTQKVSNIFHAMSILQYKVVSYIASTGTQPYCHGYYDTREVAERVCNDYNAMYLYNQYLIARVEKA